MTDLPREKPCSADTDDSDLESGEERDDPETETAQEDGVGTSNETAIKKRKRGNVWQSVVLEDDLSSSLAKVSTSGSGKASFVDLDAPVATTEEQGARVVAFQQKISGNFGKKPKIWRPPTTSFNPSSPSNPTSASDSAVTTNSSSCVPVPVPVPVGEKRKNTMNPKCKRRIQKHPGGNVTTFFSTYPDWHAEVDDNDTIDVAAGKAIRQLKEHLNPSTITTIVMHCGNAETRRLLQMTKTIEEHGGMLTIDNKHRRSPGGVFITLFKSDAEKQLGKDAVRALLAKPKDAFNKQKLAAKKGRALQRRIERRNSAQSSQGNPTDQPAEVAIDAPSTIPPDGQSA